jgi:cellulose synthase/poly-beta-1,6-N-acetylglucosamine synthase-like glycosyltransferase
MSKPLVSIVVEAYNEEQNALAPPVETIDALLAQDFPLEQAELILTGSASQIEIWRGMEDSWRRFGSVVLVPVDPAESHYWQVKNKGAQIAEADLLAFIDCDALPGPRWLRSLVSALQNGADVSIGP